MDDTDIIQSKSGRPLISDCVAGLQQALDRWEGALKATCGAIVPEKTCWYLVDFTWDSGTWQYCSTQESPADLYVNDLQGSRNLIRRYEVWEAKETLGIHIAPNNNTSAQASKMVSIVSLWADNMRSGKISLSLIN